MVRETRHLWVGNLPENIREDRIRDHFKRYGRVQSVKLLSRAKDDEGSGVCATVSFMDIKSASKAHNNEQKLEDRTLTTEYHEPAAIPGSTTPIYSQRFSHGPPEEISSFERSSHFYERERDRRDGDAYLRRASSTYHVTAAEPLRGRTRDRHYRNGPYAPIIESVVSRQPPHHRSVGSSWSYDTPSRYPQSSTTPDVYTDDRRDLTPVVVIHKKHAKSRSGSNGSESGSNSGSSVSRSRSSSSSSQSGSSSCSSASSSPVSDKSCSTHSHHGSLRSGVTLQSAVSTPHTNNSSPAVHSDDRRPLAICVRNLPARSSDTSLKDGLFHEYKKHGKVTWVKVVGQGSDRYALVCFKKPDDVEKALQVSHDKLFFGCKIEVAPYQGYDVDDNEFRFVARPYEAEQDEFHPKATRTLFIGNLEKDITAPELRKHFDQFGEIIEIDIKKQGSNSSYAFCQYCDIGSVVRAMRTLDGEHLGNNRIKLGFGKSLHTNCVWVDGVAESVTEKYLSLQFSQFGSVSHVAIDRSRGHALVFYDQIPFAQSAVKEMRGVALRGRKLQVDFASRECQEAFYDHLEKQTGHNTTFDSSLQVSPQGVTGSGARGFETPSSSSSSSGGGTSRYPRYSTQPSVARSYSRSAAVSPPTTPARSTPRHISTTPRFDFNPDYIPERRPYRSYEEMSMEDGGGIVTVTVGQGPQELRHLQKERVALLEQLEDCASSGEEGGSRRRCKHRRSHSGEGSRPGTPLCDERPENLPPVEPRRTPRERPPDPLSLPLPRFATQLLSPRPAPPSPPASPPRPQSTSSDDSEPSPPSPEWEERLRSLDEKYEKWSGSRTVMAKVDPTSLRVRHKLLDLDLHELQPSDIVKSVLAKRSVFDEDSKRLENFGEKYEPREFIPTRPGISTLRSRLDSPTLHSPSAPTANASPAGAKGLQYPFPSHPPVQPTTSVATTTAAMPMASCSNISSGITTLSPNVSLESSKSPQTFSTTCLSTLTSSRQFPATPSPFHLPPKISPPPPHEKKTDCIDPLSRINCGDKTKTSQKLQPNQTTEKLEVLKKDAAVAVPPLLKPLKSCLRRESGDERREPDGRRKSREEDLKISCVLKSECDRGRETGVLERRRSLSDPRRRESVDSTKDNLRSDSVSDKTKDRNHKEERRRRDSVDNSVKKDSEICSLSDRLSEQSDTSESIKQTDSSNNLNCDTPHDDNLRYSQPTDTSEKKKDSLQVCPERDRRRGRDSVDSSDSNRNKRVPESLDIKKELESDARHRDSTEKSDVSFKKSVENIERRKDSSHTDNSKNIEVFDKRKEKDISVCLNQDVIKHKDRRDQIINKKDRDHLEFIERHKSSSRKSPDVSDSFRHKDERLKPFLDVSRNRENNVRKELDTSDEHLQKHSDCKKEHDVHQPNYLDTPFKKEQDISNSLNCSNIPEEIHETLRLKDIKKENDLIVTNFRQRDNNKHDYTRNKETAKKKEFGNDLVHMENDIKKEDFNDSFKFKPQENERHSKQASFEFVHRIKDYEKKKDEEKNDFRSKNIERTIQNDVFEMSNKHKNSDSQIDVDTTNQISEWVEEIRKDLESAGLAKNKNSENDFNKVISDKKKESLVSNEGYVIDQKKEDNNFLRKSDIKKEEFDVLLKENERNKLIECRYYDGKRMCDTAEIFRRKEIAHKKEANDIDYKLKGIDKRKDNDVLENSRHRYSGERKKELPDRDRNKEKNSTDFMTDHTMQKEWLDEKCLDKKHDLEKLRNINRDLDSSEKEFCDSDSAINSKDDSERYEKENNDSTEQREEENSRKNEFFKKEKKKERLNSWPAVIGCKRRLSSQDSLDVCIDESKKVKPERRDSKDSGRSSSSSKKSSNEKHNKSFTKLLEEKIKEDKERELNKKRKDDEVSTENLRLGSKKDKKNCGDKKKTGEGNDRKGKVRHKENGITASESETGSGDDGSKTPKRHSIFDIVDEEPAYISMYDKVKARSTKNMQKQEEEKRQERLKEKFNQLKQSRAKREEKKRSTSYDEDSDSERGGRRSNKLLITSSEEDAGSESDMRTKGRKIMSDTSEDDTHRHSNPSHIKSLRMPCDDIESKQRKIMSDTSEDDTRRLSLNRINVSQTHQEELQPKARKILSDTSEDDIMKHCISRNKPTRIQSDESEIDLGYEDQKKDDGFIKKTNDYATSDLFSNISEDPEHPSHTDIEREQIEQYHRNSIDSSTSDIPRKKSHKKKQKRQKNNEDSEEGSGSKRHISKKDRRKSSHSHDVDEDQSGQTKIRKKKSDTSKRDEKMEDIFGPLSDDSDKAHSKWHVSKVYGSDSDEERQVVRKRDKKRKERKARELDEAGRALEAKLLIDLDNFTASEELTKTKKKKRKKSREEKNSKHHQQRLEEEAAALANEADSEREPDIVIQPPSLPRLIDSPPPSISQNKKPDIPGFGSQVDENIHETAVKSISESPTKPVEEKREPIEEPVSSSTSEDKPTPVISQEETEDAVAALLMEDSFGGGFEGYTKPDTPVSEPDLQIDTDTEDTFDPIDFSKPPRTPDIPTSFYRQQDTREGLEERILALACPDNSSSKNDSELSNGKSPPSINIAEYHENDKESKTSDKNKTENLAVSNLSANKDKNSSNIDEHNIVENTNMPTEVGKRHDLPPLVCQGDTSHVVQPIKTNYTELKSQVNPEQALPKVAVTKVVNAEKLPLASSSPVQTKILPSPDPPPLVQTTNHANLLLKATGDVHSNPVSSSSTPAQTEGTRNTNTVQSQLSNPSAFSTSQFELHKNKISHVKSTVSEANPDKSSMKPKSVNQIIVTPTTSVALIVQSQSKQSNQQNNTVLQLSSKMHSPGNQQLEMKSSAQVSQYVLHHTLQSSQILGSQQVVNKLPNQQSVPLGQVAQGQPIQGSNKLSLAPMPSSAKSPGIPVSTKSTVQSCIQDQKYKQVILNNPHNQQLSVNVSHSHQVNTSHSPAPLSFSPHHIKVSVGHQQTNNVHPNTLQHSPNFHHQQISPLGHQQKVVQHSTAVQQPHIGLQNPHSIQLQNKNNAPVLQQVPNCITNIPLKLCSPTNPGSVQTIRHLSPVSQSNSTNKMNSQLLQAGIQQVRTVVLQNPVKQTVTVLQPQVVQKSLCPPMIRPLNAPQPGVVHTLKNDPPLLEKSKNPTETLQTLHTIKTDVPASKINQTSSEEPISLTTPKIHRKPSEEEPVSSTASKEENEPVTPKSEKLNETEITVEHAKTFNTENRPLKSSVEDIKPLNAVIQDLTYKAAQAATCINNQTEDTKSNSSKPLDQVVQEIHDRKKAAEPKETVKTEEDTESSKIENNYSKVDVKPEFESDSKKELKDSNTISKYLSNNDNYCNIKEESKEGGGNMDDVKPSVEDIKQEKDSALEQTSDIHKAIEEPKVEKIRIKKEENGLCIDSVPLSEKEETSKRDVHCDLKTKSDDCLTKSNEPNEETSAEDAEEHKNEQVSKEEIPTVSSRGRGRRRKAGGRVGGVVTRRARLNNSTTSANDMASADVYEFRDDSEEEANRPRLILTIKSPPDPSPSPSNNNNSASTRKSRRLQEKDGSRTTVDDTIEDVIRGTRGGRRSTRATGNCPVPTPAMETRKSPRRKQSAPSLPTNSEVTTEMECEVTEPTPPPASSPQPAAVPPPTEPMTLIDPVTGLLIPMQESEEGQYIPVNADQVRPVSALLESKEDIGEPVEKRMRINEAEMSLPTRPGIPVKVPPNCAVVPPLPPKTITKPTITSDLPRPIIAHSKPPGLTKTTGIVVPSGIPRPNTALALTKPLTIATPTSLVKGVMMSPTGISKASLTNVVGPMTINRVAAPPPVSPSAKPVPHSSPINHKTHLLQAVAQRNKVPVAKVPTPMTPKAHILQTMTNSVVGEGIVGPGTPPPLHHGALLTGSVASPPLRAPHHTSQQPVVTGASSTRVVCKGLLEPVKVEPGGCIVVPTASPQSRSQVMQAGLPVPAYEASLHGLVAELLPNPQWSRQSPPPAHQPQGEVVQHVNYPHHIQPAHYVHSQLVYQQYLREAALTGGYHIPSGGVVKGVKSELEEGVSVAGGSPPLELRRGSPHDRATDSPQVATVYVHGPRHLYYEPPPAHRPAQPRLQVSTPPHASQVPPQADSLLMLLQRYPVMWQGLLALKTDQAAVQMHFVFGNPNVARDSLPCNLDGSTPPLRIAQRMRLEQTQLEGVARKMQTDNEHCMLLALPCGRDHMDVLQQSNNLQSGFITYLQQKQAAGIINIAGPGSQQAAYVVHIFPSCDFANESLTRIAPDLLHRVANIAHLLIVIATV